MPDIGMYHPPLVHFVVALGIVGVLFRLVALTGRLPWTGPAATVLLVTTALAGVVAAEAGDQAHEAAEQIPGVRQAVQDHEDLGEDTRDIFLVVGALELLALGLRKRERLTKGLRIASGVTGLVAAGFLFEAAEHGGELVYSYAGGVGTRTGDTADVHRLLIAGLYHQADVMRQAGRSDDAARLTDELVQQMPNDPTASLLGVESRIQDRHDPAGALTLLEKLPNPTDDPRLAIRIGILKGDALVAMGKSDSARSVLMALKQKFPTSHRLADAIAHLK